MISQLLCDIPDDNISNRIGYGRYERYRSKGIRRMHVKISDIIPHALSPINSGRGKHIETNLELSDGTDPEPGIMNDGILNNA